MEQKEIVSEIIKSTKEVFTTMLGVEVTPGEPVTEQSAPGPTDGVVSLIGLAGSWVGTGSISCSAHTACRVSSRFLMMEYASVDEDVLDAMAEMTNMIIGSFKTSLEERLGPMGLSIPTVIFGRNFTTRSITKNEWILVPFTCEEDQFMIHVCLARSEPTTTRNPRVAQPQLHSQAS